MTGGRGWRVGVGEGTGTLAFCVNGVLAATAGTSYTASACSLVIGAEVAINSTTCAPGTLANFMTGWIGEVAVYSMVLPLSRVQAHYLAGRLGVAAPSNGYGATGLNDSPLGYWRL